MDETQIRHELSKTILFNLETAVQPIETKEEEEFEVVVQLAPTTPV